MRLKKFPLPKGRSRQDENRVTFVENKEFRLRHFIATTQKQIKQNPCLYELSLVFSCLKENTFNEKLCCEELESFNNCMKNTAAAAKLEGKKSTADNSNKNSQSLSATEINNILKKYKHK